MFSVENMSTEGKNATKNQKHFVDTWLEDLYFAGLLRKVKNAQSKAYCTFYHETIGLSSSRQSVLTDHAIGKKKHGDLIVKKKNLIKSKSYEASL